MFYDIASIKIKAGDGGNGLTSFRRERYVAKGGPDGGDGGKGGSVFLKVNSNLNTLSLYNTKKNFSAESGTDGGRNDKKGRMGEDLYLEVPQGTMIFDELTNELLFDLTDEEEVIEIAEGGKGGFGNTHFANSRNQAPQMALLGEPGEERELRLELKLVADVAIIGIPSAGKSTLISVISNAKPKIADYPFTTIVPNLGVVTVDNFSFVAVDVPGLIKDAYKGKGLGDKFLRHIERSRIIVHLLDTTSKDPVQDYKDIRKELKFYNSVLLDKPEVVAVNKIDSSLGKKYIESLEKKLKKITDKPIFFISAVTKAGVNELVFEIVKEVKIIPRPVFIKEKKKVFRPQEKLIRNYIITKDRDTFSVSGIRLERIASQTNPDNYESLARLDRIFDKVNLKKELIKKGIKEGHTIKIGKRTATFREDKIVVLR